MGDVFHHQRTRVVSLSASVNGFDLVARFPSDGPGCTQPWPIYTHTHMRPPDEQMDR